MHMFLYSVFFLFLLHFPCWLILVIGSSFPPFPKAEFLQGFQNSSINPWNPRPLVPPWGDYSSLTDIALSDLCCSAFLTLVLSPLLVWSVLFMKLFIFHNGCTLKTTSLLNVSGGFPVCEWLLNSFLPGAQTAPVSRVFSLFGSTLICLAITIHSRRGFQYA